MSGISYDNPMRVTYNLGLHDYGAAGDALAIPVPLIQGVRKATRCRIESIALSATETFTAVTTGAFVRIGDGSDPDKYAELAAGTLADTDALDLTEGSTELKDNGYGGAGVVDVSSSGENISQLEVALVAPTGGTPAGIAHTNITIAWW